MRFEVVCLIIFIAVSVCVTAAVASNNVQERLFVATNSISFTTFTVLKVTTTTTSTFTSRTTCTTSTATLTTCTIGRRRRGLFYDEAASQGRNRRGLFYNDEDVEIQDGNAFLLSEKESRNAAVEVVNTPADESLIIPLEIEAGFSVPSVGPNRFLLSFGTSTVTSIVITTTTVSLTAFCLSTSGFPLCGGARK